MQYLLTASLLLLASAGSQAAPVPADELYVHLDRYPQTLPRKVERVLGGAIDAGADTVVGAANIVLHPFRTGAAALGAVVDLPGTASVIQEQVKHAFAEDPYHATGYALGTAGIALAPAHNVHFGEFATEAKLAKAAEEAAEAAKKLTDATTKVEQLQQASKGIHSSVKAAYGKLQAASRKFEGLAQQRAKLLQDIKRMEATPSNTEYAKALDRKLKNLEKSLEARDATMKALQESLDKAETEWAKSLTTLRHAEADKELATKAKAFEEAKVGVAPKAEEHPTQASTLEEPAAAEPKTGDAQLADKPAVAEPKTGDAQLADKPATRTWAQWAGSFFSHKKPAAGTAAAAKPLPVERTPEFRAAQDAARAYAQAQRTAKSLAKEHAHAEAMANKDASLWSKTYRSATHKAAGVGSYVMQSPRSFAHWLNKQTDLTAVKPAKAWTAEKATNLWAHHKKPLSFAAIPAVPIVQENAASVA